ATCVLSRFVCGSFGPTARCREVVAVHLAGGGVVPDPRQTPGCRPGRIRQNSSRKSPARTPAHAVPQLLHGVRRLPAPPSPRQTRAGGRRIAYEGPVVSAQKG